MSPHTVASVMSADVSVARTTTKIADAVARMNILEFHALPVVDDEGKLDGILTATDIIRGAHPDTEVGELMSREPVFVSPDTLLIDAARIMRQRRVHHLVVSVDDRPVGIVSAYDLLAEIAAVTGGAMQGASE